MSVRLMAFIDFFLQLVRHCDKPFGGLSVMFVGDPLQMGIFLSPEEKNSYLRNKIKVSENAEEAFYLADELPRCNWHFGVLNNYESKRAPDEEFQRFLAHGRRQEIDDKDYRFFESSHKKRNDLSCTEQNLANLHILGLQINKGIMDSKGIDKEWFVSKGYINQEDVDNCYGETSDYSLTPNLKWPSNVRVLASEITQVNKWSEQATLLGNMQTCGAEPDLFRVDDKYILRCSGKKDVKYFLNRPKDKELVANHLATTIEQTQPEVIKVISGQQLVLTRSIRGAHKHEAVTYIGHKDEKLVVEKQMPGGSTVRLFISKVPHDHILTFIGVQPGEGNVYLIRTGFPVSTKIASTPQTVMGIKLDSVFIDTTRTKSDASFYVSCSRCECVENIELLHFPKDATALNKLFRCDPLAKKLDTFLTSEKTRTGKAIIPFDFNVREEIYLRQEIEVRESRTRKRWR
jgi:hypothetical protein